MKSREEIQQEISNEIVKNNWTGLVDVACRVGKTKISLDSLNKGFKITIIYPETNIKQSWVNDIKNYLNTYKIKSCFGLSGSLSVESKQEIFEILGLKTIFKYSIQEAISDEIISDYLITVISTPLDTNKNIKVKWKGGEFMTSEKMSFDRLSSKINDWENYSSKQLKMMRLSRMRIIMNSKSKIELTKRIIKDNQNNRLLVFCGTIDVSNGLGISSYHSKSLDDSKKDEFLSLRSNHLAIVNKLNTGITFPKLDIAILNYYNSNTEVMCQKISRVMNMDYSGKIANIIIISSTEEVERKWLLKSLALFDTTKIKYIN